MKSSFSAVLLSANMVMVSLGHAQAKPQKVSAMSPREGGAYGFGGIWFDRERLPEPKAIERDQPPAEDAVEEAESEWPLFLAWSVTSTGLYETRPGRRASNHPDWHWDNELAPELEWAIADDISLTYSAGLRTSRYARDSDFDSDESFASLQLAWRFKDQWLVSLRHESFWDYTPGFDTRTFAAHTTDLRLKHDSSSLANTGAFRWQSYVEAAHSFAEPSQHDWFGLAIGTGCAIRILPQTLSWQNGVGISYQWFPNYEIGSEGIRRGWNFHTTSALVWTPSEHVKVAIGIGFMHSAENASEFRFNNISVPFIVNWSW